MDTPPRGPRAEFRAAYEAEHATTLRVLRAFPADRAEFQPHPRSSSARRLAWTFVIEGEATLAALRDQFELPTGEFPPPPESWDEIVEAFAAQRDQVVALLAGVSDESLAAPVRFFTAPRQVGDVPKLALLRFFLGDQIHHRGQLSVYLRMVGSPVPSIYGPSADDPWT